MNITETRTLHLSLSAHRRAVESLLADAGLRLDPVDNYVGVFDADDNLIGGAGLKGNVIKCVAVSEKARGLDVSSTLISRLRSEAAAMGIKDLFLFTKPENEALFTSLAFHIVGRAPKAILMESNPRGISAYCSYLQSLVGDSEDNGVIVMNCNPFTLGHRYLIEKAAAQVEHLFIIPVKEDLSEYSYAERKAMIEAGCADLPNVTVCEGSPYAISAATFPSYFIKSREEATDTSILLDLDIFTRHIAPALKASVRFAGTEPQDALTAHYNELMRERLPQFIEVDRLKQSDKVVSASVVRELLANHRLQEAARLVPASTLPYLLAHEAARCLREELHLTPKPGLVDDADNGAHSDMNPQLMERSIDTLRPFFVRIAQEATTSSADLQKIGMEAEAEMLKATGGVNTHKGAIFAMSLAIASFMRIWMKGETITPETLANGMSEIARQIPRATDTHGTNAKKRYDVESALDTACGGYRKLTEEWLPCLLSQSSHPLHRTLLRIMQTLDDTNVLHRGGQEGASYVKEQAESLLNSFSIQGMSRLNTELVSRNISPGGAADMLALTLLFHTLTSKTPN